MNSNFIKSLNWQSVTRTRIHQFVAVVLFTAVTAPQAGARPLSRMETVFQQSSITGTVTDGSGQGIPGVSVLVKGTTNGTLTDANGRYTLNAPATSTLVYSYVGYISQEVPANNRKVINVKLAEDVGNLNEVVVTGYATEQRKDIVGSVSIVDAEALQSTPTGNVTSQLQGRSPGVTVSGDGSLDGGAKVRIRGFGSFTGSEPLYVIDGVPVSANTPNAGSRSGNTSSAIDNLNPNDIASVQVLKDAASASIYGARAANGVVIITTKKGKAGAAKITVDSYTGINYVSKGDFPDLLNARELGELYWKQMEGAYAATNNAAYAVGGASWKHDQFGSGATPVIPEYILVNNNGSRIGGAALERMRTTDPALFASLTDPKNYDFKTHQIVKSSDTDWFDEIYNPAPITNIQLGASGGSDNGNYALSLNYLTRENTAAKTNTFDRYTMRANSNFKIKNNIRLGENIQFSFSQVQGTGSPDGAGPQTAWVMSPLIPVYDIMGNPASSAAPQLVSTNDPGRNQVTETYRNRFDKMANYGVFGNVYAEVDILKGLTARTSFGLDYASRNFKNMTPITYEHAENTAANSISNSKNYSNTWTWTNTLTYSRTFAEKHDFKILAGTEAIRSYAEDLFAQRLGIAQNLEDNPNFQVINAGIGAQTNSGTFRRSSLYSLFSRVDYAFAGKYLFNATLRRDESSRFSKNNRVGYFPAVAAGWRISSENFMKNIEFISDLKLRGSYGIIGNQSGLPDENQYNVYVSSLGEGYPITGAQSGFSDSYTLASVANQNAKWEQNATTNIGLDASLFKGTVDFTIEVYKKTTKDLLVRNQAPVTGTMAVQPFLNAGDMVNKGIDIGIAKRGQFKEGFTYEVGLTFSKYKNEVTRILDNPLATIMGASSRLNGSPSLTRVGSPIGSFYGYQLDGFFNTQAEVDAFQQVYNPNGTTTPWIPAEVGNWRIKDVNGDNVINALDRTIIGSPHPDFQSSLNLSMGYKNFDFTAFVFWNQGGEIFNLSRYNVDFNTFQFNRSARMLNESWTPELGNNAKLPKLNILDNYSNSNVTDYYLEDASYVRLKTIQLGYTLPTNLVNKAKIDRIRVYVQAQNLFTSKNATVLDPDAGLNGDTDTAMGVITNTLPTPKQIIFGLSVGF
jgi:TonB-linked SusC/RagA family outer membrane protein